MHPQPTPPQPLDAEAAAILTNPAGMPRFVLQTAWDALKRDRGQPCHWDRLNAMPSHIPAPPTRPADAITESVETITARCAGRAKWLAKLRNPNGGGAA